MTPPNTSFYGVIYFDEKGCPRPIVNADGTLKHFSKLFQADAEAEQFENTMKYETRTISLCSVVEL